MRRKDREVTRREELDAIIQKGEVLHLGLMDGGVPYVVPLNYGFAWENGRRVFYFHGAKDGKKLDLISKHPRASFCITLGHGVIPGETAGNYSFGYESVMGKGRITVPHSPEEKRRGLACLFARYAPGKPFDVQEQVLAATAVLRLEVEAISGKRRD